LHTSPIPRTATKAQAVAILHNHEWFLESDPHMSKFEKLPAATDSKETVVPEAVMAIKIRDTESYSVTDVLHTLPAGLWDSNVVSTYEFTDLPNGVFVRIRSPMSVVMDTVWTIQNAEGDDAGLVLHEDVTMSSSKLLLGIVKSACETNWTKIHAKMLSKLDS
jgi:hypothetical protein